MVKFIEVDPKDIPNFRDGHRGRVSYPILKSFLETNKPLVQLDRTGMQQSLQGLNSALNNYIKTHLLPIRMFTRGGQIYLARTDMDEHGNLIAPVVIPEQEVITTVTGAEALARYEEEEGQVTK